MRRIPSSNDVSILSCEESGKDVGLGYPFLVEEVYLELAREESMVESIIASLEEQGAAMT
jgi:hypothetical protein